MAEPSILPLIEAHDDGADDGGTVSLKFDSRDAAIEFITKAIDLGLIRPPPVH